MVIKQKFIFEKEKVKKGGRHCFTFWLWKIAWAAVNASAIKMKHTSAFNDYFIYIISEIKLI
jgi:hypothetical protein